MLARFLAKRQIVNDIWVFWFEPERPMRFIAGQYVELTVPHTPMDTRGSRRWLSISSAPHEGNRLPFTMRIPEDCSSFKRALMTLQPGASLHISEPIGDFVLPRLQTIPAALIAYGIGITPMRSIVSQAKHEKRQHIMSFHAALPSEFLFSKDFADVPHTQTLAKQVRHNLPGYTDTILAALPAPQETMFYLSGPELPVIATMDNLLARHIDRQQIVLDYFPGY